ncbi:MAG TPA: ATP-binding protein, partial [Candidatus Methylomirabilis sp.]|nr:ATP-binding protein [Candidatus Methylomirabilis sp.]
NVARHAHASRVRLRLRQEAVRLVLEIADDGRGMTDQENIDSTSFGLIRMRERARFLGGEFTIVGQPGAGTTVTVTVPVPET